MPAILPPPTLRGVCFCPKVLLQLMYHRWKGGLQLTLDIYLKMRTALSPLCAYYCKEGGGGMIACLAVRSLPILKPSSISSQGTSPAVLSHALWEGEGGLTARRTTARRGLLTSDSRRGLGLAMQ